jgi:hypothetical protein
MPLDPDVAYWAEMAEVRATADVYLAAAAGEPDGTHDWQVLRVGGGVAVALRSVDIGFFNRVMGLGIEHPATEAEVDEAIAFLEGHDRHETVAMIPAYAQPAELPGWFEARGYVPSRRWVKMWHDLTVLPEAATDIRIERIGPEDAEHFTRVITAAFFFPEIIGAAAAHSIGRRGWSHYVGYDRDVPVSAAAMRIDEDVAWLGFGATVEAARGRGGQSALFARRLADAQVAGCHLAITETGEETPDEPNPSYRNMVRAGFQQAYLRQNRVRRT